MATGIQMLEAVREAIKGAPDHKEFRLSVFDAYDLKKLTPSDLEALGADPKTAEAISTDLLREGSLEKLSEWLGARLVKDKDQRNLIPGEGFRRTAGMLANGNESPTPDEIVEEIKRMRRSNLAR